MKEGPVKEGPVKEGPVKEGPVRLSPALSRIKDLRARPASALAAALVLAAFLIPSLAGCYTPLPRPGQTTTPPEVTAAPVTPTALPTTTGEPAPTRPPAPTATPPPTVTPTLTPDPTRPTTIPTAPPPTVGSTEGLMLQVYTPEDGATVPGSSVAVYGQTAPGARVLISGVVTEVDAQGGFRTDAPLKPNENVIVVVATNEDGELNRISRRVTSLALPFLLLITEPKNESIVSSPILPLSGRTGPNAIVSINSRSVPVDRFGYFSSTVRLDEGPSVIDVVATNDDGQTLSTVLAVIYRQPNQ